MSYNLKKLTSLCQELHLLYVEDDAVARQSTLKLLNNFFANITVAYDGIDGLKKFNNFHFDLILSDINMPNLNGLDMIDKIKEKNKDIPCILLSSHNDSEYFLQAIDILVDAYIMKPLEYKQFYRVIYKVVEKIDLLKHIKAYQENLEAEVEKRNKEIIYTLNFDTLTGLYSRHSFFRDLEKLKTPVILLVDIDKFKIINEVYGNTIGSKVLQKFSTYLNLAVSDGKCSLYRTSADEFAIVDKSNFIDPEKYEDLIAKLFRDLNNIKLKVEEYTIAINITIGLSSVETNSYESAKIALDYAKEHRRQYVMYSSVIDQRKKSSLTLECRSKISSAIDNHRVVPVYQAIVNKEAKVLKYETLMRIRDENTPKLLSPCEFLDVAVKTRLYEELSTTIIFAALEKLREKDIVLSINVTYSDIENNNLIKKIENFFLINKEVAKRVVFEITEDQAIENYGKVKAFIKKFRSYGVKIAIDDFGSGFSNFEYILEIEPDYLKIDGSLIKDININAKLYTLVEAIVQFSHKLGIKVIAEYVHSKEIFDMLKNLNIDEYQGYYFSKPLESIK